MQMGENKSNQLSVVIFLFHVVRLIIINHEKKSKRGHNRGEARRKAACEYSHGAYHTADPSTSILVHG